MHTFLLIAGLCLTMLFFLIDKNLLPGTLIARKHIKAKLEKNKKREMQLQSEFENLVTSYKAWSLNAFPHSDVTYGEYIALMKEKSSIEYSDIEFEKLTAKLERKQLFDYIEKLKNQEEAAVAMQADLACQKRKLQSLFIAEAS